MIPQQAVAFEGDIGHNLQIAFSFVEKDPPGIEAMEHILKTVSLDLPLDHDTKMLSGGELSRLSIARALMLESETYLVDEPTSALDDDTQSIVMKGIMDYASSYGATLIIVTHSAEVAGMCGHNLHLLKGGGYEWIR